MSLNYPDRSVQCFVLMLYIPVNNFSVIMHMGESKKFCQRGSNFFFDKGKEDPYSTKSRSSSASHLNGFSLAGRRRPNIECWLGSFAIFQGIWTTIAKKP